MQKAQESRTHTNTPHHLHNASYVEVYLIKLHSCNDFGIDAFQIECLRLENDGLQRSGSLCNVYVNHMVRQVFDLGKDN